MNPLADKAAYEDRFGDLLEQDQDTVETLLGDASDLILEAVAGSTASWVVEDEADVPRAVTYVCVSAVRREFERGDGIAREQLGEHSVSYRSDQPTNLYLTRQERRTVRRAAGLSSAQTVTLVSPYSGDEATSNLDFDLPLEEEEGS